MARNVVLLSDGTGNSAGKLFKTNVWRVYQALDLAGAGQVAYYDDGVGTSSVKPLAMLGGAFGWGLKRNVLDLYTFLCRNYADGDNIYGIGFSRGAFTIRVLVKFVLSQGLVTDFNSNDDLRRKAVHLYRRFRRERTTRFGLATVARGLRDLILRPFAPAEIKTRTVPGIKFLGLWDTVDAYGLPIEELKQGIDRYLWPLALEDSTLDTRIKRACHALSIDDRRTTFHPLLWDESDAKRFPPEDRIEDETLTQVWFAGVHANLGGGYPDDGLSFVSLKWMIAQARASDLVFNELAVKEIEARVSPFGRLYDSRAGLAAYYRYGPRRLDPPRDRQGACIPRPKVHESVIWRLAAGTDAYAPLSLPSDLRIVTDRPPEPAAPAAVVAETVRKRAKPDILELEQYLSDVGRNGLAVATDASDRYGTERRRTAERLQTIQKPDPYTLELIWDTVWWRRASYFATVAATIVLLLLPWLPDFELIGRDGFFGGVKEAISAPASSLGGAIGAFAPGIARPWVAAFEKSPWLGSALVIAIAGLLLWGNTIDRRIHDRALAAWNSTWQLARYDWFVTSVRKRVVIAIVSLVIAAVVLAGSVFVVIQPSPADLFGVRPACMIEPCDSSFMSQFGRAIGDIVRQISVTILFGALALASALAVIGIGIWLYSLRKAIKAGHDQKAETRGIALWAAHKLRTSRWLAGVQGVMGARVVPAAFAILLVGIGIAALNRAAFALIESGGLTCVTTYPLKPVPDGGVTVKFSLEQGCHRSRLALIEGSRYQIEYREANDWRDGDLDPTEISIGPWGFATPILSAPQMLLGVPMRRLLTERWFMPVVRVGATGTDEHVLRSEKSIVAPRRTGELFFYVNDAVIGIPRIWDLFYRNNGGTIELTVRKIEAVAQSP